MPTQTQGQAGAAPATAPPIAPVPPQATITTTGSGGAPVTIQLPRTQSEVEALVSRRDQLSTQIGQAMSRRNGIVDDIRQAPDGVARTGLEQQIALLDEQILAMQRDLAATNSLLAQSPGEMVSFAERISRPPDSTDRIEVFALTGFIGIAAILLYRTARRLLRRRRKAAAQPALPADTTERLERLERGMESIAIEIERISEGQRFVTRLMAENAPAKQLER